MTKDAYQILEETSRTFFIPIARLPERLRPAVASAYLCMRSIDEVEDLRIADPALRVAVLRGISSLLQSVDGSLSVDTFDHLLAPHRESFPEVTLRLGEWCQLAPADIRPRVWEAIAAMAERMAWWTDRNFQVESESDLNHYTYSVAGGVGILLSDLWAWYDGTRTDRVDAIGFGRGLQATNILRNRDEDLAAGVDFFPTNWDKEEMHRYAARHLATAERYTETLPEGAVRDFCGIPLRLAQATLTALAAGRVKLTRDEVIELTARRGAERR